MRNPRRLFILLGSAAGVLLLVSTVAFFFVLSSYRDVLLFEERTQGRIFEFWLDLSVFEEGDPPLIMKVRTGPGGDYTDQVLIGFANSRKDDLPEFLVIQRDGLHAVILGSERSRPLLIWEPTSDLYAPTRNRDAKNEAWLTRALIQLSEHLGVDTCLGQLSSRGVECRYAGRDEPVGSSGIRVGDSFWVELEPAEMKVDGGAEAAAVSEATR